MEIQMLVHLEPATEGVTWWCESGAVPGFTAAAGTLQELIRETEQALDDLFSEPLTVTYQLVDDHSEGENPDAGTEPDTASGDADDVRQVTRNSNVAA